MTVQRNLLLLSLLLLTPVALAEPMTKAQLLQQEGTTSGTLSPQTLAQVPEPNLTPEEDSGEIDLLNEVTVTATRRSTRLRDTSSTVYIVGREELEQKGANNVGDAIRGVPGVQTNLFGAGSDVHNNYFIRGLPNSGLGILVDGRLITNLNQEHFDLGDLPVNNLEQVEVLTGSGAVLYGSNAVGGVVNLITRRPTEPLEARFKTEFGSYGYSNYLASFGGKMERFGYMLDYQQFDTSNDYYYEVQRPTGLFTGVRPNGYVNARNYNATLTYDLDERNRLALDAYVRTNTRGIAPFTIIDPTRPLETDGEAQFEITRLSTESQGVALTYDSQLGLGQDSELQVVLGLDHNRITEQAGYEPEDLGVYTDISAFNAQVRHNWQFDPTNNFTYGFDYIREFGNSAANDGSLTNFDSAAGRPAIFGLYTWTPSETLLFNVGARYTVPDPLVNGSFTRTLSSSFDPGVGARWQITPTLALRGNYQSVYRAPNFNDLFGATTHIGNPFLEAETGTSLDVGVDWQPSPSTLLRLTYFHSDINNLVDYLLVRNSCAANGFAEASPECVNGLADESLNNDPASNAERFRVSYPRLSTSGLEGAFNWQVSPRLGFFATITLTDSRILEAPDAATTNQQLDALAGLGSEGQDLRGVDQAERDALIGTQYPLVPFSTTRLGVTYEEPTGFQASLFANLSGQRTVDVNHVGPFATTHPARLAPGSLLDGYTTLDFSARLPLTSAIVANVYIDNLLGTYYERSYGNPAPSFNFRVGLAYGF